MDEILLIPDDGVLDFGPTYDRDIAQAKRDIKFVFEGKRYRLPVSVLMAQIEFGELARG